MIASYTAVLSLEQAKNYLRIDSGVTADDLFIESMVNAAFQWIERYTNHILVEQDKTYYAGAQDCAGNNIYYVYDFPIEEIQTEGVTERKFNTYSKVTVDSLELAVTLGYEAVSDVPEAFKQAAYAILQVWYYNSEKTVQTTLIPDSVKFALDPYRRFPLF